MAERLLSALDELATRAHDHKERSLLMRARDVLAGRKRQDA
jgi:hypothetical protein